MKLFPSLALAALLSAGAAWAANTPTATPAGSAAAAASHATSTSTAKHHSAAHCEKQAKSKKLTGDAEKKFVKECTEGKTTS